MGGIDALISKHGTTSAVTEITVRGEKFTLHSMRTAKSVVETEKLVGRLVRACELGRVDPESSKHLPQPPDVLRLCGWVMHVVKTPTLSLAQVLRLADEAGPFFLQLGAEIMTAVGMTANELAEDEVDDAGEASGAEVGGPSGPSSAETSTDAPLRNSVPNS